MVIFRFFFLLVVVIPVGRRRRRCSGCITFHFFLLPLRNLQRDNLPRVILVPFFLGGHHMVGDTRKKKKKRQYSPPEGLIIRKQPFSGRLRKYEEKRCLSLSFSFLFFFFPISADFLLLGTTTAPPSIAEGGSCSHLPSHELNLLKEGKEHKREKVGLGRVPRRIAKSLIILYSVPLPGTPFPVSRFFLGAYPSLMGGVGIRSGGRSI